MKKKINTLLLLLLIPILSYSQIKFGAKGSIHQSNVSKIHGDSDGRTSGSIGGIAQISISNDNQFFIQPEVIFSLQGEKDSGVKFFQNYINVPVMFRAYFSEDDNEFFGELGPELGFLVSQKNKDKDYDKPQSFNLSIGAGIGYSFLRKYEVSIRYNYGLTDVYKNYSGQQRTSILGLTFTYMFDSY